MAEEGGLDQLASRLERGKRTAPTPRRPRPDEASVSEELVGTTPEPEGDGRRFSNVESFVSAREAVMDSPGMSSGAPARTEEGPRGLAPAMTEPLAPPIARATVNNSVSWEELARQLASSPTSALTVRIRLPLADMLERVVYQARECGERISRVELTELALLELSSLGTTEVIEKIRFLRQVAERRGS